MKSFQRGKEPYKIVPEPEPVFKKPEPETHGWKCIACGNVSDMLFEGNSYCQKCLTERLRIGK